MKGQMSGIPIEGLSKDIARVACGTINSVLLRKHSKMLCPCLLLTPPQTEAAFLTFLRLASAHSWAQFCKDLGK